MDYYLLYFIDYIILLTLYLFLHIKSLQGFVKFFPSSHSIIARIVFISIYVFDVFFDVFWLFRANNQKNHGGFLEFSILTSII